MTDLSLVIRPERPEDAPAIERLHARAFGPGRFARTAYRLREGAAERIDLGITASVGSFLVGSVRMGPVRTGATSFVMLGPLAVDPSFAGRGIGGTLTRAAIEGARQAGRDQDQGIGHRDSDPDARIGAAAAGGRLLNRPAPDCRPPGDGPERSGENVPLGDKLGNSVEQSCAGATRSPLVALSGAARNR